MAEPIIDSKESELPNSTSVEEIRDDLANLVPISKETKKFTEIEDVRRNALSVIAELTDIIQCAPSSDTIHTAIRHVRSAISVARGLPVIGTDHQYLKTKSYPSSKLDERQKRFSSTKKKRKSKPKISLLSDTTAQELENVEPDVCPFCFKEDPPSSDGNIVEWVECGHCKVWVHASCDYIEDKNDYVCCMCQP